MGMDRNRLIWTRLVAEGTRPAEPLTPEQLAKMSAEAAANGPNGTPRYFSREKAADAEKLREIRRISDESKKNGTLPTWSIHGLKESAKKATAPRSEVKEEVNDFDGAMPKPTRQPGPKP